MINSIHRQLRSSWIRMRRWRRDEAGTSMITTAVTMPLLIVVLFIVFDLFYVMSFKWALDRGVREAAQYLGEEASFWEERLEGGNPLTIGTDPLISEGIPPQDFYDIEAKRIIMSRLMNVVNIEYDDVRENVYDVLTRTLQVRVTEPTLSVFTDPAAPGASLPVEQGHSPEELCFRPGGYDKAYVADQQWRHWENIRFRVYAQVDMPLHWVPFIPYTKEMDVHLTFKNRAIGYVECARFSGQRQTAEEAAKGAGATYKYGREGPAIDFRKLATPYFPTVTPRPTDTPAPTNTPAPPTVTPATPIAP